jgi:hypothetical protein
VNKWISIEMGLMDGYLEKMRVKLREYENGLRLLEGNC